MGPTDAWPSYYTLTSSESLSLASCKTLCVSTVSCRGIQYSAGSCQVWTRRGGIQASQDQSGSLCLRLGSWDTWEDASSFISMEGTCGGQGLIERFHGHEMASSLQECEIRCASIPGCRGAVFGAAGCRTWHGSGKVEASAEPGTTCHSFEPFRDVDGGVGRACRGATLTDLQDSYYSKSSASSLEDCQDQCARLSETTGTCKGISFDTASGACRLWTRPSGIEATATASTWVCQRYEPFVPLDGGRNRACRGQHSQDTSATYYTTYSSSQVASLEACRVRCLASPGCRGRPTISIPVSLLISWKLQSAAYST